MIRVPSRQSITSFSNAHQAIAEVDLGEPFLLETYDCYAGQIDAESVLRPDIDMADFNRATGPVKVAGVQAGDWVRIQIEAIDVTSPGVMAVAPGLGILGDNVEQASTRLVSIENGRAWISGDIGVPVEPMVGVIGVAPAGAPVSTECPGTHGGNLDTSLLTAGSAFLAQAKHDGCLVAAGDLHAAQGDGELGGTGIEIGGQIQLRVDRARYQGKLPAVCHRDGMSLLASALDLKDAIAEAFAEAVNLMKIWHELDWSNAYRLTSIVGRAQVSQIVNPLATARLTIPKEWCPGSLFERLDEWAMR
ncbi:acetamidase/formamidase family protein [Spelaeicoccus albus]|uniref:Amidase n=1 Tax=Spelaeicoccus albus TaxID=1280376 RepID=A0A7Z0IIS4_9MICO|nr:acetamidase/formamidase family protein [Spelaeicoccus albus]NYI68808.1 amidase [Spelaeicoccus albus]